MAVTGWTPIEPEPLPAAAAAGRTLDEVLRGPDSPAIRASLRAERQAEQDRAAEAAQPDTQAWRRRMTGQAAVTADAVLARHANLPDRAGNDVSEMRRARAILAEYGLDHVLPGRIDGIFSENGFVSVGKYQPDPAREEDLKLARMQEGQANDRAWMRRYQLRHPDTAVRAERARERAELEQKIAEAKAADAQQSRRKPMIER